jgi:hypothetical protein
MKCHQYRCKTLQLLDLEIYLNTNKAFAFKMCGLKLQYVSNHGTIVPL